MISNAVLACAPKMTNSVCLHDCDAMFAISATFYIGTLSVRWHPSEGEPRARLG